MFGFFATKRSQLFAVSVTLLFRASMAKEMKELSAEMAKEPDK